MIQPHDYPRSPSRAAVATLLLLGFVVLVLYWNTSTTVFPATGDGYSEWQLAEHPVPSRPNHLLLTPVFLTVHRLLNLAGADVSLLRSMVLANAVSGALALMVWAAIGLAVGVGWRKLLVGGLVLAVSSVWWHHSREPESAMISQLLFLLAVFFGILARTRGRSTADLTAGGAAYGIAVLLSLNLVVFAPVFLVLIPRDGGLARWAGRTALWCGVAALNAVPWFLHAYSQTGAASGNSFFAWITAHPTGDMMGVVGKGFSPLGVLRAPVGLARCFESLESGVPMAVKLMLTGQRAGALSVSALGSFALVVVLSLALVASSLWALRYRNGHERGIAFAVVAALMIAAAVNSYWLGSDPQFWLPVFPLLLLSTLLVWQRLARSGKSRTRALASAGAAGIVLILLFANFSWPVPTNWRPGGGAEWATARRMAGTMKPKTLLLATGSREALYVKYHAPTIERVSLLHDIEGGGDEYRNALRALILEHQRMGWEVVTEGLKDRQNSAEQGMWENMRVVRGYDQAPLLLMLGETFELQQRRVVPGYPMIRIGSSREEPSQG